MTKRLSLFANKPFFFFAQYAKTATLPLLFLLASCGNGEKDFVASGTFEATEIIISAETGGKLMCFDVKEGQELNPTVEIGYIDTVQLYLKKRQLLANRKAVESKRPDIGKQIAATQQQIVTAQREKKRVENLLKSGAATSKQLDDADSQLAVLRKQLEAQLSTLQNNSTGITEESSGLEIQIAQLDDQLRKSHLSSPIHGTVLTKYAEAGELAMQGKPLFKVADMENLFLRAYITADQLTQMKLGQQVRIFADFGKGGQRQYRGTVAWISDQAEFTPKTIQTKDERANQVYAVKVAVKNDGYLKIGMYGELKNIK